MISYVFYANKQALNISPDEYLICYLLLNIITWQKHQGLKSFSMIYNQIVFQAIERIGRFTMKGDKVPDDLLVISCEEDYSLCTPLLEKGKAPLNHHSFLQL